MFKRSLTFSEIAELNKHAVWLARLSKSFAYMQGVVAQLPVNEQDARRHTVQERGRMLRVALYDLEVEWENVHRAILALQRELNTAQTGAPEPAGSCDACD